MKKEPEMKAKLATLVIVLVILAWGSICALAQQPPAPQSQPPTSQVQPPTPQGQPPQAAAQQTETFGNAQILEMHNMGLPDDAIIAKIRVTGGNEFDTSLSALIALKTAGVSNQVTTEMLKSQGKQKPDDAAANVRETQQVPQPQQADPNNPMVQYEPGIYLTGDDGKLIKLEPGEPTRKRKTPGIMAYAFILPKGGEETCYFNDKPPVVSSHRPELTFYFVKGGITPYTPYWLGEFAKRPTKNMVLIKLAKEGDRTIFKYKYNEKLEKRLLPLNVEATYKNIIYKAAPQVELTDGDYAIGSFDFDMASSSGATTGGNERFQFSQYLFLFTVKGGKS
jgi:hypothetical protein